MMATAGSHQDRRRHNTPRTTLATTQSTWIWRLFPDWVSSSLIFVHHDPRVSRSCIQS